jgi:hypothetical protein
MDLTLDDIYWATDDSRNLYNFCVTDQPCDDSFVKPKHRVK